MNEYTELERKLIEYENLPGHMLGLEPWLLRSIPEDKRADFLKGYEKLVRVIYFPDHAKTPKEKKGREKFIQALVKDVAYLTSDPFAFELAIESIPSRRNPVVGLKMSLEDSKNEIAKLEHRLSEQQKTNRQMSAFSQEREEFIGSQKIELSELQKQNLFVSLRDYQNWIMGNRRCIPLNNEQNVVLFGRKMSIKRVLRNTEGKIIKQTCLFDLVHGEAKNYEQAQNVFSEKIEEGLLSKVGRTFMFEDGKAVSRGENITLIGSLPYLSIRHYTEFNKINLKLSSPLFERESEMGALYSKLLYAGMTKNETHRTYEKKIKPFVLPFVALSVPALLRTEKGERASYELIYVQEMDTIPKGSPLDFWFSAKKPN